MKCSNNNLNDANVETSGGFSKSSCGLGYVRKPGDLSAYDCNSATSCQVSECCEVQTCANSDEDGNYQTHKSTGFSKENCGVGKVLNHLVVKDPTSPKTCPGRSECTASICCESMTCATNNGDAYAFSATGFQKENCG